MTNLALIGCGYWGKNYVNTIQNNPEVSLKYLVDLVKPKIRIPSETKLTNLEEVLNDKEIDGVMIVTPTKTHYEMCSRALEAGKNVLVEKPITHNSEDAKKLCELAENKGVKLMVGHIFKYNSAVREIKGYIDKGELGDLRYIESRRVGLGPIRNDVGALWDLITHDIYIGNYVTGKKPIGVSCISQSHNKKVDDICSLNMRYPGDIFVSIYANWEHPIKERKIIFGGTKKAVLFDDMHPSEKIMIYERGVDFHPQTGDFGEFQATTREGGIIIPKIKINAPLDEEIRHFLKVIKGEKCISDGYDGLDVVRILEAADSSMKNSGIETAINY